MSDRLVEESVRYAADRQQFGQAIGAFQLVQGPIADSRVDAYASKVMTTDVARRFDAGEESVRGRRGHQVFHQRGRGRVADRAVQIHGGAGYMAEYKVERFYRDVRLLRIYEGTSQIQQTIIARSLLRDAGVVVEEQRKCRKSFSTPRRRRCRHPHRPARGS
ncbi:acyl-CoA dehydrogenase family protein [Sphingomonas sp. MMS24-JH45]